MSCCMFKSNRSTQVRRLWRLRVQNEARGPTEKSVVDSTEDVEFKTYVHVMLKRLKDKQLETLIQSVEMKGGEECSCVHYPHTETKVGKMLLTPALVCCKMWRWRDISCASELKRMPCCSSGGDNMYECINPYHWSRLTVPDSESLESGWSEIRKSKITDDLDRPPEVRESMETGMTPTPRQHFPGLDGDSCSDPRCNGLDSSQSSRGPHWCSVAYWELRDRVGRLLPVHDPHINIFQDLPHGDGLCLQVLQEHSEFESVRRTREKIGLGVLLSSESDGVWVYNRSDYPIFVNSPTLENPLTRMLYVHKVNSGYALKIFDYARSHLLVDISDPKYLDGPYDPQTVRISFAKGWGPHYSRQFLTSCPCWLEVMLSSDVTTR